MSAPVESPAARLARIGFLGARRHDAAGIPRLSPDYVAEQGRLVRILDVREESELTGLLGHVPACTHVPMRALPSVPEVLGPDALVSLVSTTGTRAGTAAMYLKSLGMKHVAAIEGGVKAWKRLGFSTSRSPDTWRKTLVAYAPGVAPRDGRALDMKGAPLCADHLIQHAVDAGSVRWVRLSAFTHHGRRSCVDGRDESGVIGTPGGDMGELALALSAVEAVRGRPIGDDEVQAALLAHIDAFGRFYMHTDIHAMNHLIVDGYRKDPRIVPFLDGVFEAHEWRAFHLNPPAGARDAVLEHLIKPENMGCGHLRHLMTNEAAYGVRPALATALLRAFHQLRWAGAPELEWVVLGGEHREGGVVEVVLGKEMRTYTRVPLVSPMVDGVQVFVAHPEVVAYLRREAAAFFVDLGLVPATLESDLRAEILARGERQLGATLARLAAGLPVFRLAFEGDRPTASEVGRVPKA